MPVVYGVYVPNAPNLIAPEAFGGVGASTVDALRSIELVKTHRPDALVVMTPHWVSGGPFLLQASASPRQIYDFSGFPPKLSTVTYRPRGDPSLAHLLADGGTRRGVDVRVTKEWGLDHGAWAPLLHLAPGASVPVVPASITHRSREDHVAWGAAMGEELRTNAKRVVVVGTGSILHRLDRFAAGAGPWEEGRELEDEVVRLALAKDVRALTEFDPKKWRALAPEGELGPLFAVLGAVGSGATSRLVASGQAFGAAGLSILEFVPG